MKTLKSIWKTVVLALAVCIAVSGAAFAAEEPHGYEMPENAVEFVPKSEITANTGSASFKGSSGTTGYYSGISFASSSSPYCTDSDTTYNTDHSQYITSVKNQGGLGTCWIFGTVGALETAIWKQLGDEVDLSEMYMVYATSNSSSIDNPYNAYEGKDTEFPAEDGGHEGIISAFWSRGTLGGLVPESALPYYSDKNTVDAKQLCEIQELSESALDYYPSQTIFLGTNTQYSGKNYSAKTGAKYIQETKDLIRAFGSVAVGYYDDSYYWNYSGGTATYNHSKYSNGAYDCNHEVLLVGWDDSYDMGATNKGAFLVRNSWGANPSYGGGYFWMSYDTYFTDVMAVSQVVHASELYDRIYETDSTIFSESYNGFFDSGDYALMKRTYTTSGAQETLTGLMIYNVNPGTEYKVYCTDSDTVDDDTEWTELEILSQGALSVQSATGYTKAMNTGYLTLELASPTTVSGNYTLAVVVRRTDNAEYEIYGTDYSDPMYGSEVSSSLWWSSDEITADNIQSATRLDGDSPVNFTLKAFTRQTCSTVSSAEYPCLYEKGVAFNGNKAVFSLGAWTTDIPVYTSCTEGSPAQYITSMVYGNNLTLTLSTDLRGTLTNYTQRCYLGFQDANGNEIRIPVTLGKAVNAQTEPVLQNGILYMNRAATGARYIAALYSSSSGRMRSGAQLIQSDHAVAFDLRSRASSGYRVKVFTLDSAWVPKATPYEEILTAKAG